MDAVRGSEFAVVSPHWQELRGSAEYFFQTPEWLALAEAHLGGDVVWGALLEDARPVAVSVLRRWRRSVGAVGFIVLSEAAVFDADPPLADGLIDAQAVDRIRFEDLLSASGRWHAAWLRRLRAGSCWLTLARAGDDVASEPDGGAAVVDTTIPADEWYASLPRNMRDSIRKARNRIEGRGGGEIVVSTGSDIAAAYEQYVALEAQGYKTERGTALALPAMAAPRKLLGDYLVASPQNEVRSLFVDGRLAAAQVSHLTGRGLFLHKVAYDEQLADLSPGNVLMAELIEACCADPGVDRIDCGGWQPWHERWGMEREPTYRLVAFNRRCARGALAGAAWDARRAWRGRR
jgi:hypothetical protein